MQSFQKRILRIIGISQTTAKQSNSISESITQQTEEDPRWPKSPTHGQTQHHQPENWFAHLQNCNPRTEKYQQSIVPKCLRILRDGTSVFYTAETHQQSTSPSQKTETKSTQCHFYKRKFKGEKGLNQHKRLTGCSKETTITSKPPPIKNPEVKEKRKKAATLNLPVHCPICQQLCASSRGLALHQRLKNCLSMPSP